MRGWGAGRRDTKDSGVVIDVALCTLAGHELRRLPEAGEAGSRLSRSLESASLGPLPIPTCIMWVFLLLGCMCSFYVLDLNPVSKPWFGNVFSHAVADFSTR